MKTRMFVSILILVFAVLIASDSFAQMKKPISDEELTEAYTGTWINPEIGYYKPKVIFYPGKWEEYTSIDSKKPYCYGDIELMEKWKNSKGDIFFEYRWECMAHGTIGHELIRISDSGNTMERLITRGEKRVEEWDPDNPFSTYRIHYRQE